MANDWWLVTAVACASFLAGLACGCALREAHQLLTGRHSTEDVRTMTKTARKWLAHRWRIAGAGLVALSLAVNAAVAVRLLATEAQQDELGACQLVAWDAASDLWTSVRAMISDPQGTNAERRQRILEAIDDYVASLAALEDARKAGDHFPPPNLCDEKGPTP